MDWEKFRSDIENIIREFARNSHLRIKKVEVDAIATLIIRSLNKTHPLPEIKTYQLDLDQERQVRKLLFPNFFKLWWFFAQYPEKILWEQHQKQLINHCLSFAEKEHFLMLQKEEPQTIFLIRHLLQKVNSNLFQYFNTENIFSLDLKTQVFQEFDNLLQGHLQHLLVLYNFYSDPAYCLGKMDLHLKSYIHKHLKNTDAGTVDELALKVHPIISALLVVEVYNAPHQIISLKCQLQEILDSMWPDFWSDLKQMNFYKCKQMENIIEIHKELIQFKLREWAEKRLIDLSRLYPQKNFNLLDQYYSFFKPFLLCELLTNSASLENLDCFIDSFLLDVIDNLLEEDFYQTKILNIINELNDIHLLYKEPWEITAKYAPLIWHHINSYDIDKYWKKEIAYEASVELIERMQNLSFSYNPARFLEEENNYSYSFKAYLDPVIKNIIRDLVKKYLPHLFEENPKVESSTLEFSYIDSNYFFEEQFALYNPWDRLEVHLAFWLTSVKIHLTIPILEKMTCELSLSEQKKCRFYRALLEIFGEEHDDQTKGKIYYHLAKTLTIPQESPSPLEDPGGALQRKINRRKKDLSLALAEFICEKQIKIKEFDEEKRRKVKKAINELFEERLIIYLRKKFSI